MAENRELALVLKLVADQFQSELRKSGGLLGEFNKFVSDWKVQLTAAGGALFAVAKSTANYGDELVKMSQRLGESVENTARLQHAARLSDTDLHGLAQSVGFLSKEMLAAAGGNEEAQRTFDRLGVSVRTSNGQLKGSTDILLEIGDKFRLMPQGPEKTAMAMLAMGKSGKEVLPFLNSDLRAAFNEADKLGLVMDEKAARAAEHFNDELTKLQGAIRGVTNDVGTLLIPKFDALAHAFTTIITDARTVVRELTGLNKVEAPQVDRLKGSDGKSLLVMPNPSLEEQKAFPTDKFFLTDAEAAARDELRRAQLVYQQKLERGEREMLNKQIMEHLNNLFAGAESLRREVSEEVEGMLIREKEDNERTIRMINQDFAGDTPAERQEAEGRRIVAKTQEELRAKERDGLIENIKAWQQYGDALGASNEFVLGKRLDLARAELAKELDLNVDQAGRLLIAWQNHDDELADLILAGATKTAQELETIQLRTLQKSQVAIRELSDDFFAGWAEGMRRYVKDTQSGFGLSADMARRAFQTMEQSAGRFFFDAMEGRITRLKDVFSEFLNFAKQISSQIAGQLITKQIAGAFVGGFPSLFGPTPTPTANQYPYPIGPFPQATGGIMPIERFAGGGIARRPQMALFGEGSRPEAFVPLPDGRTIPVTLAGQAAAPGVTVVVNNYANTDVQTSSGQGPDGRQMIYVTIRDMVKGMLQGGEMDSPFQRRFGLTPRAASR